MKEGVGVPNVLCFNGHGQSGQIMDQVGTSGYVCRECGRRADIRMDWHDETAADSDTEPADSVDGENE